MSSKIFKSGLFSMLLGNVGGKGVALAATPLITRLYSPEEFGQLALLTAVFFLCQPLINLRLAVAIPLESESFEAEGKNALLILCFFFSFLMSLICGSVIFLLIKFDIIELSYFSVLLVTLFVSGIFEGLYYYCISKDLFTKVSFVKFYQSAGGVLVKIGLGYLSFGSIGLILGFACNQVFGFFYLLRLVLNNSKLKKIALKDLLRKLKQYRDFPTYRLSSQFLLMLAIQCPILVFDYLYDKAALGQLSLTVGLISVGVSVIASSVGQVFYQQIAQLKLQGRISELKSACVNLSFKLSIVAIIPTLICALYAEEIFMVFFGEKWQEAGIYASILVFPAFFQFISSPLINVYNVIGSQLQFLLINIRRLLLISLVFFFSLILGLDKFWFVIFYALALSINYFLIILFIIRKASYVHRTHS